MKKLFITFEGGEGSGKSTQAKLLYKWLKRFDIPCVITKEPGSPHIQECMKIRELLLNPSHFLTPSAELLLFLADRTQHVDNFIKPELEKGNNVICDRYMDSTRVYQCANGISRRIVEILSEFATGNFVPDITFLLDVPVEIGLKRAKKNSIYKDGDRIENAGIEYHEKVRYGFLKLAENINESKRFKVIRTTPHKTVNDSHSEIITYVSELLWG